MCADVLTPEQRKYCMSRIRSRDTGPEITLRKALWAEGFRYRLKNSLPGRPDIVFPSARLAVFIDGCFWHGCPEHSVSPKTNAAFWRKKIRRNIERDVEVGKFLRDKDWQVIRFWEHEIKADAAKCVKVVKDITLNQV